MPLRSSTASISGSSAASSVEEEKGEERAGGERVGSLMVGGEGVLRWCALRESRPLSARS